MLQPLVSVWFQVLFTPLLGVLFTFPLRYWFTIGLSGVFSLTRWCWYIQTEFLRFRPTRFIYNNILPTGLSPSTATLSSMFCYTIIDFRARPRSLATTCGISIDFFSSGYLDVSVLQVRYKTHLQCARLPHSDIYGLTVVCTSP
jgi:hypothetical protein